MNNATLTKKVLVILSKHEGDDLIRELVKLVTQVKKDSFLQGRRQQIEFEDQGEEG